MPVFLWKQILHHDTHCIAAIVTMSLFVKGQDFSHCNDVIKNKQLDTVSGTVRYVTGLINVDNDNYPRAPFAYLNFVNKLEAKYSLFLMVKDSLKQNPTEKGVVITFEGSFKLEFSDQQLIVNANPYKLSAGMKLNAFQINLCKSKRITAFKVGSHEDRNIDAVWAEKTRQQFACMSTVI